MILNLPLHIPAWTLSAVLVWPQKQGYSCGPLKHNKCLKLLVRSTLSIKKRFALNVE